MKLKTLEELKRVAEVRPPLTRDRMSKRRRLERWAEVLELAPQRHLRSLNETEYASRPQRCALREDNSPLTVAFQDPVLHAEGLQSDLLQFANGTDGVIGGSRLTHQLVTVGFGDQDLRVEGIAFDLLPQPVHVGLKRVGGDTRAVAPDLAQ